MQGGPKEGKPLQFRRPQLYPVALPAFKHMTPCAVVTLVPLYLAVHESLPATATHTTELLRAADAAGRLSNA